MGVQFLPHLDEGWGMYTCILSQKLLFKSEKDSNSLMHLKSEVLDKGVTPGSLFLGSSSLSRAGLQVLHHSIGTGIINMDGVLVQRTFARRFRVAIFPKGESSGKSVNAVIQMLPKTLLAHVLLSSMWPRV